MQVLKDGLNSPELCAQRPQKLQADCILNHFTCSAAVFQEMAGNWMMNDKNDDQSFHYDL